MRRLTEPLRRSLEATCEQLRGHPMTERLFRNAFPNALTTTTEIRADESTFVVTGDLPAMWLRDSAAELRPYLGLMREDPELVSLLGGLVRSQAQCILIDPYANAFNREPNDRHWCDEDLPRPDPSVWERKYELDSLAYFMDFAYRFWKQSGATSVFDNVFRQALHRVVDLLITEQRHDELSTYYFCRPGEQSLRERLPNKGRGAPTNPCGLVWSGFRPSDDACTYGYLIPSNAFAVAALRGVRELVDTVFSDSYLAIKIDELAWEIDLAIQRYGIVEHRQFGRVYCYETDAMGNYLLMDDANIPSLLSMPYLGYCGIEDEIYQNTRRLVLSDANPYYHAGRFAKGIGSPHTRRGTIWHLGLAVQGLTSYDQEEIRELLAMFEATHADTWLMHESFDPDAPADFTRPWFGWANSLYAQFVLHAIDTGAIK